VLTLRLEKARPRLNEDGPRRHYRFVVLASAPLPDDPPARG